MAQNECRETEEVLAHHLRAFAAGDIDMIMTDYADDAVVITPQGIVVRGAAQIMKMHEMTTASIPPGSQFQVTQKTVTESMACIVWNAESAKVKIPFGTDTFFIKEGRIVAQTFACQMVPKN